MTWAIPVSESPPVPAATSPKPITRNCRTLPSSPAGSPSVSNAAASSPASPSTEAADRYSPPMAEAFSPGRTVREATKKSLVVRENRQP